MTGWAAHKLQNFMYFLCTYSYYVIYSYRYVM